METAVLDKQLVMVPQSLVRGWKHPAVQRLRFAVQKNGDTAPGHLQGELERVLLKGAWMTAFLPVPFTEESVEGKSLSSALLNLKARFPNRAMVQDFVFKFWNPDRVDELALLDGGVEFETAFQQSFTLSEDEAKDWPESRQ
jgi:hypothetical protein